MTRPVKQFTKSVAWQCCSFSRSWCGIPTLEDFMFGVNWCGTLRRWIFWAWVSREEIGDMSLSRPWDVCIIFCMKEKDVLERDPQSPVLNQNWRAFPIMSHLRVLFSPAGTAFPMSL
jgi:hypothetical protein